MADNERTDNEITEVDENKKTSVSQVADIKALQILPPEEIGLDEVDEDRLGRMMATNYIEYASYVIRDRAIPALEDGLKPVQRRILHSLNVMDDGRFHKVANVIGHTMQYHPHGDASIGGALVVLANKEYFIDRQGNFGNIYTGDEASAARYIECRLSPLAREVLFNRETTEFLDSYDGRNQEPVTLPAKVPALLMLGADGIAVGMTTHVLPHNFRELLEAQILILQKKPFTVYPDFLLGGIMDVSEYDDGRGRVVVRARIEKMNDKTIVIREIPATTTTEALVASIEDAVRKGRLKIAGINDYTAENIEIEIKLARNIHAPEAIKQLYAYTNCQVAVNSNIVVIRDNMPVELSVSEVLRDNTKQLVRLLKLELEIKLEKLEQQFHQKTLAQIFIENRIYKRIEEETSNESIYAEIYLGLEPFRPQLLRDVVDADIEKLLQLQIRRISRFDINKNREELEKIVAEIAETKYHLDHLIPFAISYIRSLIERFASRHSRRTEIADIEEVDVKSVALTSLKVGHDRVNHFIGTEVRNSNKGESSLACTEYDRLVLLQNNGVYRVIAIPGKLYTGPTKYLYKLDKEQIYCLIYRDKKSGVHYAKRFCISRFILEREYRTIPEGCIIENIFLNEGVILQANLKPSSRREYNEVEFVFESIPIRSATARGFRIAPHLIESFTILNRGTASGTLDGDEEEPREPDSEEDIVAGDDENEEAREESPEEPQEARVVEEVHEPTDEEREAKIAAYLAKERKKRGLAKSGKREKKTVPEKAAEKSSDPLPSAKEETAAPESVSVAKSKEKSGNEASREEGKAEKEGSAPKSPSVSKDSKNKAKALGKAEKEDVAPKSGKAKSSPGTNAPAETSKPAEAPKLSEKGNDSEKEVLPSKEKEQSSDENGSVSSASPEVPDEAVSEEPPPPAPSRGPRKRIDEDTPFFLE